VYSIHKPCQTFFCSLQGFIAEIYRTAIVGLENEETDGHRAVSLCQRFVGAGEELIQCDEVAEAFTHFLSVDGYHVVMHPVMYHVIALRCYGLCNLTFVVREDKVHTATVNVEMFTQIFLSHCRTFGVPAGEAVTPWTWPAHDMFRLGTFPQCKVGGIVFFLLAVQFTRSV